MTGTKVQTGTEIEVEACEVHLPQVAAVVHVQEVVDVGGPADSEHARVGAEGIVAAAEEGGSAGAEEPQEPEDVERGEEHEAREQLPARGQGRAHLGQRATHLRILGQRDVRGEHKERPVQLGTTCSSGKSQCIRQEQLNIIPRPGNRYRISVRA